MDRCGLPFEYITEPFIEELELLEPYGQGNEKPQFAQKGLFIRSARVMGRNRNVVRISLVNDRGTAMDGVILRMGIVHGGKGIAVLWILSTIRV